MSAAKKRPALELPAVFMDAVTQYLGPRAVNKLSIEQSLSISRSCNDLGGRVAMALDEEPPKRLTHQLGDAPSGLDDD